MPAVQIMLDWILKHCLQKTYQNKKRFFNVFAFRCHNSDWSLSVEGVQMGVQGSYFQCPTALDSIISYCFEKQGQRAFLVFSRIVSPQKDKTSQSHYAPWWGCSICFVVWFVSPTPPINSLVKLSYRVNSVCIHAGGAKIYYVLMNIALYKTTLSIGSMGAFCYHVVKGDSFAGVKVHPISNETRLFLSIPLKYLY